MKKNYLLIIIASLLLSPSINAQINLKTELYGVRAFVIVYEKNPYNVKPGKYKAVADKRMSLVNEAYDVKLLMEEIDLEELGIGKYIVSFSKIGNDLYRISDTDFIIETNSYSINTYSDFYLEITSTSAFIKEKKL